VTFSALALSGSLRKASINTALARATIRLAPPQLHVELIEWVDELPWVNADLEDDLPAVVDRWQSAVRGADALIIALPEYNTQPPALVKNAFDWATRPYGNGPISGKTIALLSAAGRSGGANSQATFAAMATALGAHVVDEAPVQVNAFSTPVGDDGSLPEEVDAAIAAKLRALVSHLDARG
jgi:chromate reductase, NAD(P)H dehydrogenase (quinone)